MNRERLRKLAQRLDKTPREKFTMTTWCGSRCCIAGHALIMARKPRDPFFWVDVRYAAADYLGLDYHTADILMTPDMNPGSVDAIEGSAPKQAAKVIRNLIKTGKVEWEKFL